MDDTYIQSAQKHTQKGLREAVAQTAKLPNRVVIYTETALLPDLQNNPSSQFEMSYGRIPFYH